MEIIDKEVFFDKYCPKCKHYKTKDYEDPCNECLNNPINANSHKPVYFKEREEK